MLGFVSSGHTGHGWKPRDFPTAQKPAKQAPEITHFFLVESNMAAKKKTPAKTEFEGFDDADDVVEDSWDGDTAELEPAARASGAPPGVRLRDWRDVERYREDRELRRLLGDDLEL